MIAGFPAGLLGLGVLMICLLAVSLSDWCFDLFYMCLVCLVSLRIDFRFIY